MNENRVRYFFFTLVTLFQYRPHYFVVFQIQDEPYIKAIINHIHLVQTWLLFELEMSSLFFLSFPGVRLTFISNTEQI